MKRMIAIIAALLLAGCVTKPWPAPQYVGESLPTPTVPLRDIGPFLGDIPKADEATIDLYVRSFEALNFQTEFDGPDPWIRKKNSPIGARATLKKNINRTAADRKVAEDLTAIAQPILKRLSLITGLPYTDRGGFPVDVYENQRGDLCGVAWRRDYPDVVPSRRTGRPG